MLKSVLQKLAEKFENDETAVPAMMISMAVINILVALPLVHQLGFAADVVELFQQSFMVAIGAMGLMAAALIAPSAAAPVGPAWSGKAMIFLFGWGVAPAILLAIFPPFRKAFREL